MSGEPDLPGSVKTKLQSSLTVDYGITPLFKPEISVHAKIKNSKLQDAHVIVTGDYRFTQDFTISGSAGAKISVEKSLVNPVTFTKVFNAGPVPIVIRGDLRFRIAASGSVSGTVNLNQELALIFDNSEFGFRYDRDNGGFAPVRELKKEYNFSVDGEAGAEANITLKVIPDLKISFYEAASARLRMEPYARGDAEVFGQFSYLKTSEVNNSDANYYFKELSVSGGLDIFLFAGLQIFDYDVISWPDIEEIDDALNMADGAFDESLFKKFSPIERTKILGIPELNIVCDIGAVPGGDTRKIWCTGQAFDVRNPFGSQPFIKFDEWDDVAVASVEMTAGQDYELSELAPNGGFSLLPKALAEYPVRISGHSDLGHFIRQSFVIQLDASDQGGDGMPDYWQERYALTTDNDDHDRDGLSDLDEYKNGLNPINKDTDDDGMDDAWEVSQQGLNPLQNDANEDRDGNGESNLAEYQRVQEELTPPAPENLEAVQSSDAVLLTWGRVSGAGSYNLYYAFESFGSPPTLDNYVAKPGGQRLTNITDTAVFVDGFSEAKDIYFVVTASSEQRESAGSDEAVLQYQPYKATTRKGEITAAVDNGSIYLRWLNSDNPSGHYVCRIDQELSGFSACIHSDGHKYNETTTPDYYDDDVVNGKRYYYYVESRGGVQQNESFHISAIPQLGHNIELVSITPNGTQGDDASTALGVDDAGNKVLFSSRASNFVSDDTNGKPDIFVKTIDGGAIERVSVGVHGQADQHSETGGISADGRKVVFTSAATNLDDSDQNETFDIYMRDFDALPAYARAVTAGNSWSYKGKLGPSGRYVTFRSAASDLVASDNDPLTNDGDHNGLTDVFVWDNQQQRMSLVSEATTGGSADGTSREYSSVSGGKWVAFTSNATNLVAGTVVGDPAKDQSIRERHLYLRNLHTKQNTLVPLPEGFSTPTSLNVSSDGNKIVFSAAYSEEGQFPRNNAYSYDVGTGAVTAFPGEGLQFGDTGPTIDSSGRYIALHADLNVFSKADSGRYLVIALWDTHTGIVRHVSRPASGEDLPEDMGSAAFGPTGSYTPVISSNGNHIVFTSVVSNLVSGDVNGTYDVFLVKP